MRVLTEADGVLLGEFCRAIATVEESDEAIEKTGMVVRLTSGNYRANPLIAVRNQAREQVLKLAREFGLSPSARSRIAIEERSGLFDTNMGSLGRKMAAGRKERPAS